MPETTTNLDHLRAERNLRELEAAEEGTTAERLPDGVYGFTYSPAEDVPLFAKKNWHSFEVHKLADRSQSLVGFVTGKEAKNVRSGAPAEITLFPDPWEESTELVSVPLTRAVPAKKGP